MGNLLCLQMPYPLVQWNKYLGAFGIVELWFFPFLIFTPSFDCSSTYVSRFRTTNDQVWMLLAVLSGSHQTTFIFWRLFFQSGRLSETCPWIGQISRSIDVPIIIDTIFLHFGWVSLETSIYFSGIENDSTLDAQNLTLESTWWPHMKSFEINQKSFRFSPASGNESWKCGGGGGPSDSPRKSWWRSPRIGWSRVKVDFFNSWSPPENFTVTFRRYHLLCIESFQHGF